MARPQNGFTLIELLVVMAVLGALLALAMPRYLNQVDRSREAVLRQNLAAMRSSIDQFKADHDRYPGTLQDLVSFRYLRAVPMDPILERSDSWILVPPPNQTSGAVYDVRSAAPGVGLDGAPYASW